MSEIKKYPVVNVEVIPLDTSGALTEARLTMHVGDGPIPAFDHVPTNEGPKKIGHLRRDTNLVGEPTPFVTWTIREEAPGQNKSLVEGFINNNVYAGKRPQREIEFAFAGAELRAQRAGLIH